jgi:hypothetical protein
VNTQAPSGTLVRYWLYNSVQPGNTNSLQDMPVTRDSNSAPAATTLYAYSTDQSSSAGRYVAAPAATTGAGAAYVASWLYNMPATSAIKGLGEITLWAAPQSGLTTASPTFQVVVQKVGAAGATTTLDTETLTVTNWGCTGFRPVSIPLGSGNQFNQAKTINTGESIRVSVFVTNSVPMVLAYGTSTFQSELSLPYSSGIG